MNAGQIQISLASYFDWFSNTCVPQWEIDGGIADLLFITKAGYVTEIEIKCTMSDWNADADKSKWKRERPHVSRFFYAVPEKLADRIPEWVPQEVGIISLLECRKRGFPLVRMIREAKRLKSKPFGAKEIAHIHARCYFRFWRYEMKRWRSFPGMIAEPKP